MTNFNPRDTGQATGPRRQGEPTAAGERELAPPPIQPSRDIKLIRTIVDRLSDQLSRGKVDPKVLEELGWTDEEVQAFVKKYTQRLDNRRPERDRTELPALREEITGRPGEFRPGIAVDDRLRAIRDRVKKLDKDQLRRLFEARRDTVSPEYRELLKEYWKALSEAE